MKSLSTPLPLPCGQTLGNRLAKSAMSERLAGPDLAPNEAHATLYRRWAEGGIALSITGNVMIDPTRLGEPGNVAIPERVREGDADPDPRGPESPSSTDAHAVVHGASAPGGEGAAGRRSSAVGVWGALPPSEHAWRAWAEAAGALAWVQLNHPGRQSPRMLDPEPVAPSAVPMRGSYGAFAPPRALREDEIEAIVARFASAAAFVVGAGFSGVQIHAAHGYLVSQFLSPRTNQRTDRWGGDLEGRMAFLLAVVRAVRDAIGAERGLSVKLNTADFQRGGFTEDDAVEVAAALRDERIDLLELSGGTYEQAAMFSEPKRDSTRAREAFFLDQCERVRARVDLPLMLTGGFRTRDGMEAALASGSVDVVGLARPLAVEPDLPARLLSGQSEGAVPVRLHTGIAALDSVITGSWYQVQLERLARGEPAAPELSRWPAVAWYVRDVMRGKRRAAG